MSTRPLRPSGALAILAAARAALRDVPDVDVASPRTATTSPTPDPVPLATAPPGGATGRNTAQQTRTFCRTNPRPAGVTPRQMMAARLLLSGHGVTAVGRQLGVHPYTVSRWKRNPLFEAELRRQVERATARNTAQQNPTRERAPARNEAEAK
jgi:hypothetical protein